MRFSVYTVLGRTLAVTYYQRNAGFFFVIMVFAFGLLRPVEHIALITYVLYSPFLMGMLFLLWTLYTLKTVQYIRQSFKQAQHKFLYQLYLFPLRTRLWYWFLIQVSLWQPVLLYQLFMVYVAFSVKHTMPLYWIALFDISTLALTLALYNYWIAKPDPDKHYWAAGQFIRKRFSMPYTFYFIGHLADQYTLMLLLSKVFSCGLMLGTTQWYVIEGKEKMILLLGMLFAASGNAIIVYQLQQFEQNQLQFIKNMPFLLRKRFLHLLWLYLLLLLPEIAICIRYLLFTTQPWIIAEVILSGYSLVLFYHSYLTRQAMDQETFIRHLFFISLVLFLLILFRVNGFWLALINLGMAYYLYQKYYYTYEPIILPEE